MTPIFVVSPSHRLAAAVAIAANRAGETGLLDLGYLSDIDRQRNELAKLRQHVRPTGAWGVRWDQLGLESRNCSHLAKVLGGERVPVIVLAGLEEDPQRLANACQQAHQLADQVILEVTSLAQAQWAEQAGYDGVIARGVEAGGHVSRKTSFCLLQALSGTLGIPFWVQGGLGPDTAASALLAGAAGVVLAEQVWLASESALSRAERARMSTNTETALVGIGRNLYRFLVCESGSIADLERSHSLESNDSPHVAKMLEDGRLIPAGVDLALAQRLAAKHSNVAGIIKAYRLRSVENFKMACRAESFAPDSPLAEALGTKFPILQGPMAGITDQPKFAHAVASAGALPMVALGSLDVDQSRVLLEQTQGLLGPLPWGVAISEGISPELQEQQIELVVRFRPPFAMLDGRQVSRSAKLEEAGVRPFFHVDSVELLQSTVAQGGRRLVVEGNACGGPLGPQSSFSLWQFAIDSLLETKLSKPEDVHVIFGGPIHDSLSSAMTAAAAAPLAARGMKIGLQLGSAYFFTPEAVETGVITRTYHDVILKSEEIAHLHTGGQTTIRCVPSPFAKAFAVRRAQLLSEGAAPASIEKELTDWAHERLVLAARGTLQGRTVSEQEIAENGLFRVGDLAVLRHQSISIESLHEEVSPESVVLLEKLASTRLPWHPEERPKKPKSEDIAIVGMACMFPKADDLRTYWENICRAVDAVEEVPADRWDPSVFFDKDRLARDRVYSKWGGFIGNIIFDPMKWRIPPAALKAIEPLQLLSLEVAAQAMKDAGYDEREFPRERTGVLFACAGSHEMGSAYAFRTMMRHYLPQVKSLTPEARESLENELHEILPEWTEDSFPGFLMNVVAGRIAREMNVNGPNYTVDAACAAALAGFHAAIEQLRSGTSDMVIVGGADATNNPMCYMSFSKTHALSPGGRSRPFDESGDGIGLGEGIGVVILKRLKDAERDGDKIYAVIKGIGSSSDGKNKSLTAPYPPGQIKAVERAYDDAEVCPTTVSLIEAHGTGTVVGDSAEITTLSEVFGSRTDATRFAAVGSVKSMIGHTKTVAGMASMIKTALALKHRVLPPTIGVEKPTSRFDFQSSPFYVNTQTRPWIEDMGQHPRRAGVSAFGFGGTNFHVVLEEYTGAFQPEGLPNLTPRSAELVTFGRASKEEILARLEELAGTVAQRTVKDWAGLAASIAFDESQTANRSKTCRLAIIAGSTEEFIKKVERARQQLASKEELVDPTGIFFSQAPAAQEKEVCFLYPGQGSQYLNMMKDLFVGSDELQDVLSSANEMLAEFLPQPLSKYIFPPPTFTEEEEKQAFKALSNTRVAQPALGAMELAATDLLARYGLRPAMVAGHSYGEHVALYAAGVLSRADLLWLSAMRGRVCADIAADSPGGMAAVQADAATTQRLIDQAGLKVYLANMNAPDQTIIAGAEAPIDQAVEAIAAQGIRAKRIPVSAPFHTPLLEAGSHAMAGHFAKAEFKKPTVPVYSNTTGKRHSESADEIRDLLTRHFSEPVHFEEEIRQIYADGARIFIEAGPGKILTDLAQRILKDQSIVTIAIDVPGRDGWTQWAHAVGRAFTLGLNVQTDEWFAGRGLRTTTVADFLADVERRTVPKKSDWILGAAKAEPAYPSQKSKPDSETSGIIAVVPPGGTVSKVDPAPKHIAASVDTTQASPPATIERSPEPARSVEPPAGPVMAPAPLQAALGGYGPAGAGPGGTLATEQVPMTALAGPISYASNGLAQGSTNGHKETSRTFRRSLARPLSRSLKPTVLQTRPQLRTQIRKSSNMTPHPTNGHETNGISHTAPNGNGVDLFMELQASTRMFIEFQHTQQVLMERFLDTQERLLALCLGKGIPAPTQSIAIAPPAYSAPVAMPAPAPYVNGHTAPASVPAPPPIVSSPPPTTVLASSPAAAARGPITMPGAKPSPAPAKPTAAPVAHLAPKAPAAPAAPPAVTVAAPAQAAKPAAPAPVAQAPAAPAPTSAGGPPSVEDFRRDLLAVISERTGYPEDMLDEELPLEAGLGIDSIKTVEIFSTLKRYHTTMRDEERDEEETLAEFTKLKTIRDIINMYAGRVEKILSTSGGHSQSNGSVERHVVTSASAPAGEASKKNSLAST